MAKKKTGFGTGAIPEAAYGPKTTFRTQRVSQEDSVKIWAGKKAGLIALSKNKLVVDSLTRPRAPQLSKVMPEQTRQTLAAASKMTNKTPYGN